MKPISPTQAVIAPLPDPLGRHPPFLHLFAEQLSRASSCAVAHHAWLSPAAGVLRAISHGMTIDKVRRCPQICPRPAARRPREWLPSAELGGSAAPSSGIKARPWREECDAGPSLRLRLVHCSVCISENLLRGNAVLWNQTNSDRYPKLVRALGCDWGLKTGDHPSPDGACSCTIDVVCDDRELVTAQACKKVGRARCGHEAFNDHPQHAVASCMSFQIVDPLEVVEIEQE